MPLDDSAPWDVGRKRRRPSDRSTGGNPGSLKSLPYDHPDFPHGRTGYSYGCRCLACRVEDNRYQADWRRRTGVVDTASPYIPTKDRITKHGTRWCYIKGCRRDECVQANREYQRAYMRLYRKGIPLRDKAIEQAMAD